MVGGVFEDVVQDRGHLLVFAAKAVHDTERVVDVGVVGLGRRAPFGRARLLLPPRTPDSPVSVAAEQANGCVHTEPIHPYESGRLANEVADRAYTAQSMAERSPENAVRTAGTPPPGATPGRLERAVAGASAGRRHE